MPKALKTAVREIKERTGAGFPALDGRLFLAFLLLTGATSGRPCSRLMASEKQSESAGTPPQQSALKNVAAAIPDIPFSEYDPEAEQMLLDLANQARAQAGVPALKLDVGLSQAARIHAGAMVAAHQLSHQFAGEPSLPRRVGSASATLLDQEGENVALDFDAEDGHRHLMLSLPHRANLLNADYNVVGMGVVRRGESLYIVQDFGHALPNYSAGEIKNRVAATVAEARHQAGQPDLARLDLGVTDDAACSMAQADKLGTLPVHQLAQRYTVLTYTSLHPETLPANAPHVISSHNLRRFSVGACFARTDTYPTGVYWVVLSLD
jgi:uncharacterized protein YkwD